MRQGDMFGAESPAPGSLARDFGEPPFSVLDARSGRWASRSARWRDRVGPAPRPVYAGKTHANAKAHANTSRLGGAEGHSRFDPYLAHLLLRAYSREGDVVVDPFCGDITRGAVASMMGRNYFGSDLSEEQIRLNRAEACRFRPVPSYRAGDAASCGTLLPPGAAFCLTCPPYFSRERYGGPQGVDLSEMRSLSQFSGAMGYVAYDLFNDVMTSDSFVAVVIGNTRRFDGGYYRELLPVSAKTCEAFVCAGFKLHNELVVAMPVGTAAARCRNQWGPSRKVVTTHQTVYVFVKGDPFAAAARLGG